MAGATRADAAFPGQDGAIIGLGHSDTASQLVSLDPATGTIETVLESRDQRIDQATFSSDGRRLAYSRDAGALSPHFLWTANADGTNLRRIGKGDPQDFSPDGKRIAFVTAGGSLGMVGSDGSRSRIVLGRKELTGHGKAFCEAAAWSPDGEWIAYTLTKEFAAAKRSLYLVHPDGSGRRALPSGANAASPDWSPDGRRLAFVRFLVRAGRDPVLVTMKPNGKDRHAVAGTGPAGLPAFDAIFAPSGKRILFDSFDSGSFGAYTVPVSGGSPTRLTSNDAYDHSEDWQPLP